MKFDKKVKRERREFLEREYNDFIKNNRLTKKEKQELRNWIMHGESVYSNSLDVCNDGHAVYYTEKSIGKQLIM